MLEFMRREHMETCTNEQLIKYKKALEAYHKKLLQHVYDFRDTSILVQQILRERAENLELEMLFAEEDRLNEESSVTYTPEYVH